MREPPGQPVFADDAIQALVQFGQLNLSPDDARVILDAVRRVQKQMPNVNQLEIILVLAVGWAINKAGNAVAKVAQEQGHPAGQGVPGDDTLPLWAQKLLDELKLTPKEQDDEAKLRARAARAGISLVRG